MKQKENIVVQSQTKVHCVFFDMLSLTSIKETSKTYIDIAQTDFAYLCTPNSKNVVIKSVIEHSPSVDVCNEVYSVHLKMV